MSKIIIPEIRLFNLLSNFLEYLKKDIQDNAEEDTLIYHLFSEETLEGEDIYSVAKEIFGREKLDNPRTIAVRLFFDRTRASLPTIHLNLPSEMGGKSDGMGFDEGYQGYEVNEGTQEFRGLFTRSFDTNYSVAFTSENPLEVIAMYHTFKALLISCNASIGLLGFKNLKMGGQDLQLNDLHAPNSIMIRSLNLSFDYEVTVPQNFATKFIKDIFANVTISKEI